MSGTTAIQWQDSPNSLMDAKGELLGASASNVLGALAAGTDTHVLTADATETLGLKWSAIPAAGGAWTHVASSTTEVTTTSATQVLAITMTGFTIELGTPYVVVGRGYSGTTGGNVGQAYLYSVQASGDKPYSQSSTGDLMNTNTYYASAGGWFHYGQMEGGALYNPAGAPGSGGAWYFTIQFTNTLSSGSVHQNYESENRTAFYPAASVQLYNEDITGFKIYLRSTNGSNTVGVNDVHVYKLAVSH
jgi:hypothetical protein